MVIEFRDLEKTLKSGEPQLSNAARMSSELVHHAELRATLAIALNRSHTHPTQIPVALDTTHLAPSAIFGAK